MVEVKELMTCTYCGNKRAVVLTVKRTKYSETHKVSRCKECKEQNTLRAVLKLNSKK